MTSRDHPAVDAAVTAVSKPLRAGASALHRADAWVDTRVRALGRRGLAAYAGAMTGAILATGSYLVDVVADGMPAASAQAGPAEDIMCQTGAGDAVSLVFGFAALALLLVAASRLVSGLNKKGSQNKQKIQEGDSQLKGAAYSLGGVFALTAFPLVLEQLGMTTVSCVEFAPF